MCSLFNTKSKNYCTEIFTNFSNTVKQLMKIDESAEY